MRAKSLLSVVLLIGAMMLIYFLIRHHAFDSNVPAQTPEALMSPTMAIPISIGNTTVHLNIYRERPSGVVYFNMHDDENTAVEAGKVILKKHGGYLAELAGKGERLIRFTLDSVQYTFDPNRIFTERGIQKTLEKNGPYSPAAHREIRQFVEDLFQYVFIEDLRIMVTLHNNSEDGYSLNSYLPGEIFEKDASRYYLNPALDPDDFYFVTEVEAFEFFKMENQNVVLQDNMKVTDDGSLSVYCSIRGIPYINVEAQEGHLGKQINMLEILQVYMLQEPSAFTLK